MSKESRETYPMWSMDGTVHREADHDRRRTTCGLWITRYYAQVDPPPESALTDGNEV